MRKTIKLWIVAVLSVVFTVVLFACDKKNDERAVIEEEPITLERVEAALTSDVFYGIYSDGTGGIALTFKDGKVEGQAYSATNSGAKKGVSGTLGESYTIDLEAGTVAFVSSQGKESVWKYEYSKGKIIKLTLGDEVLFGDSLTAETVAAALESNYYSRTTSGTYNSTTFQMCFKDGNVYERLLLVMGGVGSYGADEPFKIKGSYELQPDRAMIKITKTGGSVEYFSYQYTGTEVTKVFGLSSKGDDSYPYEKKGPVSGITIDTTPAGNTSSSSGKSNNTTTAATTDLTEATVKNQLTSTDWTVEGIGALVVHFTQTTVSFSYDFGNDSGTFLTANYSFDEQDQVITLSSVNMDFDLIHDQLIDEIKEEYGEDADAEEIYNEHFEEMEEEIKNLESMPMSLVCSGDKITKISLMGKLVLVPKK